MPTNEQVLQVLNNPEKVQAKLDQLTDAVANLEREIQEFEDAQLAIRGGCEVIDGIVICVYSDVVRAIGDDVNRIARLEYDKKMNIWRVLIGSNTSQVVMNDRFDDPTDALTAAKHWVVTGEEL